MAIRDKALTLLFILLCSSGALFSIWQVRNWGNELSLVDPYSEANALREVRHFLEDGLTQHDGLGTVYYPGMYPTEGFAREPDVSRFGVSAEGVYDLTGNVAEWVRRSTPARRSGYDHVLKGCYWAGCFKDPNPSCSQRSARCSISSNENPTCGT